MRGSYKTYNPLLTLSKLSRYIDEFSRRRLSNSFSSPLSIAPHSLSVGVSPFEGLSNRDILASYDTLDSIPS